MADVLHNLFRNFNKCWTSGNDAQLHLECHAGQVWVNLRLNLSSPSSSPPSPPKQRLPRKPGPARLRRRARREQARAAAENVAQNAISDLFGDIADNTTAAVQADKVPTQEHPNKPAEEAGQLSPAAHVCQHKTSAVQNVERIDAEEADHTTSRRLNINASPWPNCENIQVRDVFCPDPQYLPKLLIAQAPRNQCRFCGKTFGSQRALTNHTDREHRQPQSEEEQVNRSIT